jgi:signal transduction histidine kinase
MIERTSVSALGRVAALVAGDAESADVFAAVAREVAGVLGLPLVHMSRYEPDGTTTVIGAWSDRPHPFQTGTRWSLDGATISTMVREAGRPVRLDDLAGVPRTIAEAVRESGIRSAAGAPIVVDGRVWGVMAVGAPQDTRLPAGVERRLAELAELMATVISNAAAREELRNVVDEQTALRRIATLVAEGAPSHVVFDAVCEEAGRLFAAPAANLSVFTPDDCTLAVAGWSLRRSHVPAGTRIPLTGDVVSSTVRSTATPARRDSYDGVPGELAAWFRRLGVRSDMGVPVIVDRRVWALHLGTDEGEPLPLPPGTEDRLASFAELIAPAVSDARARLRLEESLGELADSRARLVSAGDRERRKLERDLHDGAQQRLVAASINLSLAGELADGKSDLGERLGAATVELEEALGELRELAHGIYPPALARWGLARAFDVLAARYPGRVKVVEAASARFAPEVEAAFYYCCLEAVQNASKHAGPDAQVMIRVYAEVDQLHLEVRDNGPGFDVSAAHDGIGLQNMRDRLGAVGGCVEIVSEYGHGTLVAATAPLRRET